MRIHFEDGITLDEVLRIEVQDPCQWRIVFMWGDKEDILIYCDGVVEISE